MTVTHFKAAVLTQLNEPLEIIENIKIPELKAGQVLVKIYYSGVCHSQIMEARGKRGVDNYLPHFLGHEATGEVISVDDQVSKVKVGDKVVLGWIKGEGCNSPGSVYEGPNGMKINAGGVTTFSEYSVVSENRLVIAPPNTPLDLSVLYGCALPTGAGMVLNEVNPHPQSTVVVLGIGGIGMSALQAAATYPIKKLIAIDTQPSKLELAKKFGATHTINASLENSLSKVLELTEGTVVDYAIEATGKAFNIEQAFDMIKRGGGKLVFASHPQAGDKISIDPFELICGKSIQGSWGGSCKPDRDVPRFDQLYGDGQIQLKPLVQNRYSLENINEAFEDLESGKIMRALLEIHPNT